VLLPFGSGLLNPQVIKTNKKFALPELRRNSQLQFVRKFLEDFD